MSYHRSYHLYPAFHLHLFVLLYLDYLVVLCYLYFLVVQVVLLHL